MRLVLTEDITKDMTLAKAIYDNGSILLNKGVDNLIHYKERLQELGIDHLYVEDKYSSEINIDTVIKDQTRRRGKEVVKNTLNKISNGIESIDLKDLKKLVEEISSELILNDQVLLNLYSLKKTSDYTYEHSLNVGVICIAIGKILGYNKNDIFKLGMAAIFHDRAGNENSWAI